MQCKLHLLLLLLDLLVEIKEERGGEKETIGFSTVLRALKVSCGWRAI